MGLPGPDAAEGPRSPDGLRLHHPGRRVRRIRFGRAEREQLEKYVSERGGTLVLLAGKRSMPLEYLREGEPLAKLLPDLESRRWSKARRRVPRRR